MKKIVLFFTLILGLSLANSSFAGNFSNTATMGGYLSCSISSTGGLRCSSSAINFTVPSGKFIGLDSNPFGTVCAIDTLGKVKCFGNESFYLQENNLLDSTYIDVGGPGNNGYILSINKNKKLSYFGGDFLVKNFDSNLDFVSVASIDSNNACGVLDDGKIKCWGSSSLTYNNLFSKNNYTRIFSNNIAGFCALSLDGVVQCSNGSIYNDKIYKDLSMGNGYYLLLDNSGSLSCYGGGCSYFSLPTDNLGYLKIFASKTSNYCAIKKDNTIFCSKNNTFNIFNSFIGFNDYQFNSNSNTSTSSNSDQTCLQAYSTQFDYVFNRDFSVYLKNENDYYISSSERNLSYRNKNNKDLLKINFGDFDYVYHYDNNLDRIFDVNLMYKSQFNGSLKVNNGFFDDNEIEIKVYSSSGGINFFRLKSDQDYEFELLGLSDTKKTKTSIGKFKTNTDYHLSEDFYSLFIKLDGYTFNGYNIYGLTLINYKKVYKSTESCVDSKTGKFTVDGVEVDYDLISNLDQTGVLNIINDKNSIFHQKILDEISKGPSYQKIDNSLNNTSGITSSITDNYFASCNQDLSAVNIGVFQGFVSLGFGPVKVPLTDITLNFYPFSGLTCPLKSVYYIKNDLFSKF